MQINKIIFFIILFGAIACIEQIRLDIPRVEGQLIVFGGINNSDLPQQVEILRTSAFENKRIPETGASVNVIDEQGNEGKFTEEKEGIYVLKQNSLEIIPGEQYYIRIVLITGEVYESIPAMVPPIIANTATDFEYIELTSLSAQQIDITENIVQLTGRTEVENTSKDFFLRWEMEETLQYRPTNFPDPFNNIPPPCFIIQNPDPQRINIFNGENFKSKSISSRILAQRKIDFTFHVKHFFTTITHSINRDAYVFWEQVDLLTNSTGSIFDIPPAQIEGNIFSVENPEEQVLGYFEVSNVTYNRFKVYASDSPFPIPESGCEFNPTKLLSRYPRFCSDCNVLRGSSSIRPSYFGD